MRTFLSYVLSEETQYWLFEAPTPGAQLFHKDVGLPQGVASPKAGMALSYGPHAKNAARDEGLTRVPAILPNQYQVIEMEVLRGTPLKWVLRMPMKDDPYRDLVLVVQADGFVRTIWTNDKHDTHKTLKKGVYTHPSDFVAR